MVGLLNIIIGASKMNIYKKAKELNIEIDILQDEIRLKKGTEQNFNKLLDWFLSEKHKNIAEYIKLEAQLHKHFRIK